MRLIREAMKLSPSVERANTDPRDHHERAALAVEITERPAGGAELRGKLSVGNQNVAVWKWDVHACRPPVEPWKRQNALRKITVKVAYRALPYVPNAPLAFMAQINFRRPSLRATDVRDGSGRPPFLLSGFNNSTTNRRTALVGIPSVPSGKQMSDGLAQAIPLRSPFASFFDGQQTRPAERDVKAGHLQFAPAVHLENNNSARF